MTIDRYVNKVSDTNDLAPERPSSRWAAFVARLRSDIGISIAEFLILAPMMLMGMELIVLGGRIAATSADIQSAAREAARQATIAGGQSSASGLIGPTATAALQNKGFQCTSSSTQFGPATSFVAGGQVEVVVRCRVEVSDLTFLNLPGSYLISRSAVEPIDTYRIVN